MCDRSVSRRLNCRKIWKLNAHPSQSVIRKPAPLPDTGLALEFGVHPVHLDWGRNLPPRLNSANRELILRHHIRTIPRFWHVHLMFEFRGVNTGRKLCSSWHPILQGTSQQSRPGKQAGKSDPLATLPGIWHALRQRMFNVLWGDARFSRGISPKFYPSGKWCTTAMAGDPWHESLARAPCLTSRHKSPFVEQHCLSTIPRWVGPQAVLASARWVFGKAAKEAILNQRQRAQSFRTTEKGTAWGYLESE